MPLFSEKDESNPPIDADEKAGATAKAINGTSESIEKLISAKHYRKKFNNDFVKKIENFNKKHEVKDPLMISDVKSSGTGRRKAVRLSFPSNTIEHNRTQSERHHRLSTSPLSRTHIKQTV